jgi:5-methylcytosine-specific restriction endonuclease McrA
VAQSEPTTKKCRKCGETKSVEEFSFVRKGQPNRRARCKPCETAAHREWRLANLDRRAAYMRDWKARNAEKWDAYMRAWLERHPDYQLEWARSNIERLREYRTQWREENRELVREYTRRHRARKLKAPYEDVDPIMVFVRDEGRCGICGDPVDLNDWHLDHVRPLSKGGKHLYENVQVAHPVCNRRKGAKWPISLPLTPESQS